jgi:hypothetical protein
MKDQRQAVYWEAALMYLTYQMGACARLASPSNTSRSGNRPKKATDVFAFTLASEGKNLAASPSH